MQFDAGTTAGAGKRGRRDAAEGLGRKQWFEDGRACWYEVREVSEMFRSPVSVFCFQVGGTAQCLVRRVPTDSERWGEGEGHSRLWAVAAKDQTVVWEMPRLVLKEGATIIFGAVERC